MTRKVVTVLCFPLLAVALVLSLVFGFQGTAHAVSPTSSPVQDLKIETLDGVKYSPVEHKKIAWIVVEKTDEGEKVLAFSTPETYERYHQQVTALSSKPTDVGIMSGTDYFYEHTSYQGYGSSRSFASGTWSYNVGIRWGSFWNDRISALNVAPWSWVTLYQHDYYRGYGITFSNRTSYYLFSNLTSWRMPNGVSWNDQVTSIKSGNY